MILDNRTRQADDLDARDRVAVVGSGAAGIPLAMALAARGRAVLLVESGGDPRDAAGLEAASRLNRGEVRGQPYTGLTEGRCRALGGATQLWHGQCTRMQPEDLAERAWVPGSGWPLPYSELERWYPAAERFLGLSARGYGEERWAEHRRLTPVDWDRRHLAHDFTEYTAAPHLGTTHRKALERSTAVTVLEHATVTRVELEGGTARALEVAAPDGTRRSVPVRTVVLAAGALENARLLMLSDPGGLGLGTGARHTGRYLQDHPVVGTADLVPQHGRWLQDRASHLHRGRRRLYPKVRLTAGAQQQEQLLAANAVIIHEHDDHRMVAARRVLERWGGRRLDAGLLADAATAAAAAGPLVRAAYRRYARGLSSGVPAARVWLQVWLEQAPDPESRVLLGRDRDPLGLPQLLVDWRVGEAEVRTSRQLTRWVAADLQRLGVAQVRERPVMDDDAAWRREVTDAYHPSGTTRMSASGATGVVDPSGRVHGVAGVHVAGSSTFPVAGYANPTLTIVALALRLADHLADDLADQRAP